MRAERRNNLQSCIDTWPNEID